GWVAACRRPGIRWPHRRRHRRHSRTSGVTMFENMNANQMGLLQTGLAILGNAYGPNARNAIGIGGMQGLQAMQQAKSAEQDEAYRKMQMKALDAKSRQAEREMQVQEMALRRFGGMPEQPTALLSQGTAADEPTLLAGGAQPSHTLANVNASPVSMGAAPA